MQKLARVVFCFVMLVVPEANFTCWRRQVQLPLNLAEAVPAEFGPLPVED